jgi:hypothetical protein
VAAFASRQVQANRERLQKIVALAINPAAIEAEAIAALHRARQLVKQNPALAHPPASPTPPLQQTFEALYKARITTVHPDCVLILVGLLSSKAYDLHLQQKLGFDSNAIPTALDVECRGSKMSCQLFERHVEWCRDYINSKLPESK